jgi:DNA invertase Pin-like site-specific DNA recombinase
MLVGYAWTSTTDQKAGLDAQERNLKATGTEKVYGEQASGATHRVKLDAALSYLREGGALIVTKPDRLARSTADLLAIEKDLTNVASAW